MVAHAAASARGDGVALDTIAGRFAHLGCNLLAAEASLDAWLAHSHHGEWARARASRSIALSLANACDAARTPVLKRLDAPAPLTSREREVALLAANGGSSSSIAESLGVSVRTVNNLLQRVYSKLSNAS
ncbi:MAG: helix-turn-helix transcriptional regulator [Candidatus Dormibacteria bacterium]